MSREIALEVAEQEFERMCRARRVCTDTSELDADSIEQLEAIKRRLVRCMQDGSLVVMENGDPVYTPPVAGAKPLTFHVPTGATFMAMDAKAGDSDGQAARSARAITEMTRSSKGDIAKLEVPDWQICNVLATLFLAAR